MTTKRPTCKACLTFNGMVAPLFGTPEKREWRCVFCGDVTPMDEATALWYEKVPSLLKLEE